MVQQYQTFYRADHMIGSQRDQPTLNMIWSHDGTPAARKQFYRVMAITNRTPHVLPEIFGKQLVADRLRRSEIMYVKIRSQNVKINLSLLKTWRQWAGVELKHFKMFSGQLNALAEFFLGKRSWVYPLNRNSNIWIYKIYSLTQRVVLDCIIYTLLLLLLLLITS